MRIIESLKKLVYSLVFYYHKLQYFLLSLVVVGITDYFFLYEVSISLSVLLTVELIPVVIVILGAILIRGLYKYIKRRMKENKHYLFY